MTHNVRRSNSRKFVSVVLIFISSYVAAVNNDTYISIDDVIVEEGNNAVFTVSLSSTQTSDVTLDFQTTDITAFNGSDFLGGSGSILIPAGSLQEQISIPAANDAVAELAEEFSVVLSNPVNATFLDSIGIGLIAPNGTLPCGRPASIPTGQRVLAIYRTCDDNNTWFFEGIGDGTNQSFNYNLLITSNQNIAATKKINFETSDVLTLPTADSVSVKMGVVNSGTDTTSITHALGADLCLDVQTPGNALVIDSTGTPLPIFNGRYEVTQSGACGTTPTGISIQDVTVLEGDVAQLLVTLDIAQNDPVSVFYEMIDGSAIDAQDFIQTSGVVTFPSTETSQILSITTIDDGFIEADETFSIVLSNLTANTTFLDDTGVVTIQDAGGIPQPPSILIDDVIVTEGSVALLNVHLSEASLTSTITVDYSTASGTALENSDYLPANGTLTFSPGETTLQYSLTIIDDSVYEVDEYFSFLLSNPVNAILADFSANIAVLDNDIPPCGRPSVNRATQKVLAVYQACNELGTWQFEATAGGSSTAVKYTLEVESDVVIESLASVSFESNDSLLLLNPNLVKSVMTVKNSGYDLSKITPAAGGKLCLTLTTPSNVNVINYAGDVLVPFNGKIDVTENGACDVPLPEITIADATVSEGSSVDVQVMLSSVYPAPVSVDYVTAGVDAIEGTDYIAAAGTLTFPAGTTSLSITLASIDDTDDEVDETFTLSLSNPIDATLLSSVSTITITDNDGPPGISVADVTVEEGSVVLLDVTLTNAYSQPVSVDYVSVDETASDGVDYVGVSGTLVFGSLETTQQIVITTLDDAEVESLESFRIDLSNPVNGSLDSSAATVSLTDNDIPPCGRPAINSATDQVLAVYASCSALDLWQFEAVAGGSSTAITYDLLVDSDQPIVSLSSSSYENGDVLSLLTPSQAKIIMAVTNKGLDVAKITRAPNSKLCLQIIGPASTTVINYAGTVLPIINGLVDATENGACDVPIPEITIADATVSEGSSVDVQVTLSSVYPTPVSVDYVTAGVDAIEGTDYIVAAGTLTFPTGTTSLPITLASIDDVEEEVDETFTLTLSNPVDATLLSSVSSITITDNDGPPGISIGDVTVEEGNAAQLTVMLDHPYNQVVSVDFTTVAGSALEVTDYQVASGTLVFASGQSSQIITVMTVDDLVTESVKTLSVQLSNPVNSFFIDSSADVRILDNDAVDSATLLQMGYYDVIEHGGAVGDGVTDDTAALQAAIDTAYCSPSELQDVNDPGYPCEPKIVYFPPGTYLVSDTLKLMQASIWESQQVNDNLERRRRGFGLVGSGNGVRPVIKLKDCLQTNPGDCPTGFNNVGVNTNPEATGVLKPLIHFWRQNDSCLPANDPNCTVTTNPESENSARSFENIIRNIDIDLGTGNISAVGVRHLAAEGSAIQSVSIQANDAFAGLYNVPASGGSTANVEINGGQYGVYVKKARGGATVFTGMRMYDQLINTVFSRSTFPTVFVGFDIRKSSGNIFKTTVTNKPVAGHVSFIDGSIEITTPSNTGAMFANTNRGVYLENVYVKGMETIISANNSTLQVSDLNDWRRVPEYAYVGGEPSLIDGDDSIITTAITESDESVSALPSDLRQRHLWPVGSCEFSSGTFVNIEDFGATADDEVNDRDAIQAAIDFAAAAGHSRVFVPVGRYVVSGSIDGTTNEVTPPTITLAANTQLFGAHKSYSILDGSVWAYPADNQDLSLATRVPIIQTVDDDEATTAMCDLRIEVGASEKLVYGVLWRAGGNSIYKDNNVDLYVSPSGVSVGTTWRHRIEITGNGGGKWYNHYATREFWDGNIVGSRILHVTNTREPLAFYMLHNQSWKPPYEYMSEFIDVSNLRIFGVKSEGVLCNANNNGVCKSRWYKKVQNYAAIFHFVDGENISIYGFEALADMAPGRGMFEIEDTRNIKIVHAGRRITSWNTAWPKDQWYFIKETIDGITSTVDATNNFVMYYFREN